MNMVAFKLMDKLVYVNIQLRRKYHFVMDQLETQRIIIKLESTRLAMYSLHIISFRDSAAAALFDLLMIKRYFAPK